jgi:chromosome segregation ATPase
MSQIINELATIDVSNETIQQLDLAGIYRSFSENYKKLDALKGFRSEYEKQNGLMRWWHNDQLRNAQLDSAEVQGEFSKTIGQLMLISIMQSKKLAEQQVVLNEQQHKLEKQANGIAEHAGKLQEQHGKLARQSDELKTLVEDYIALKGLTEDGMNKLVAIAKEVTTTKETLVRQVDARAQALGAQCDGVAAQMRAVGAELKTQAESALAAVHAMQLAVDGLQADLSAHAQRSGKLGAGLAIVALVAAGALLGVVRLLGWV